MKAPTQGWEVSYTSCKNGNDSAYTRVHSSGKGRKSLWTFSENLKIINFAHIRDSLSCWAIVPHTFNPTVTALISFSSYHHHYFFGFGESMSLCSSGSSDPMIFLLSLLIVGTTDVYTLFQALVYFKLFGFYLLYFLNIHFYFMCMHLCLHGCMCTTICIPSGLGG